MLCAIFSKRFVTIQAYEKFGAKRQLCPTGGYSHLRRISHIFTNLVRIT